MLEEYLLARDSKKAWTAFASLLMKEGVEAARVELRRVVCNYYWWLSGELYALEGDMGWEAGFNSWEEDTLLPKPVENSAERLRMFVERLAEIPFSSAVKNLKEAYWSKEKKKSLEARMIQFLFKKFPSSPEEATAFVYNRIASTRSEYELGAARPFLRMSLVSKEKDHLTALAGLVMILTRGVSKLTVKADIVKLIRFGRGQSFYLSFDVPDYTSDLKRKNA